MKEHLIKVYILFIGVLMVAGVGAFWVVKNNQIGGMELWKYAPRGTRLYVEFDLANRDLVDFLQSNEKAKESLENFLVGNSLPKGLCQPGSEIAGAGMFLIDVVDEKKQEGKGWIIKTRGSAEQLSAYLKDYYYITVEKNIAVVSKSKEVIQIIGSKRFFSGLGIEQERQMKRSAVGGFFSKEFLLEEIKISDDLDNMMANNFKVNNDELVFWQAKVSGNNFDLQMDFPVETINNKIVAGREDTGDGAYYLEGALVSKISKLTNIWEMIISAGPGQNLDRTMVDDYLNNKYKAELGKLYTIFEQPFFLIVQPGQIGRNFYKDFKSGENYYAVMSELIQELDQKEITVELEKFIKNYLAYKFPEKRLKTLPDKTTGYEVVANPDKFLLVAEKYGEGELRFAKVENFELGYFLGEGKMMIFNSVALAKKTLKGQKDKESGQREKNVHNLMMDPKIFGWGYTDFIKGVGLNFRWGGDKIIIEGTAYSK